jgi:hypothetical protein
VGQAFVCLLRKSLPPSLSANPEEYACVLIIPQFLACQKLLDVVKKVMFTWCKVDTLQSEL